MEHQSQKTHRVTCWLGLEKLGSLQTRKGNFGWISNQNWLQTSFWFSLFVPLCCIKNFLRKCKKSCLASVQHYATSKGYQLDFKLPNFWSGAKIVKNIRIFEKSCLTYLELCVAIVTDNRLLAWPLCIIRDVLASVVSLIPEKRSSLANVFIHLSSQTRSHSVIIVDWKEFSIIIHDFQK